VQGKDEAAAEDRISLRYETHMVGQSKQEVALLREQPQCLKPRENVDPSHSTLHIENKSWITFAPPGSQVSSVKHQFQRMLSRSHTLFNYPQVRKRDEDEACCCYTVQYVNNLLFFCFSSVVIACLRVYIDILRD
jgi:hypothetical protein